MANGTVEARMLDLIEEVCDDEVIREERDIDLFEAGLLDSMAAIELLVGIESEFGVVIAPTAVERVPSRRRRWGGGGIFPAAGYSQTAPERRWPRRPRPGPAPTRPG